MTAEALLLELRDDMRAELVERILPFWMEAAADRVRGGIIGYVAEDGRADPSAPKGSVLHARVLWTFSAACRALGDDAYRRAADGAAAYFAARFVDPVHGGVFWMLDADGRPADERKHVYAQAFAVYALAEHHRATGDARSLESALAIYRLVEAHAFDAANVGYDECFARDWSPLDDARLSDVDLDEPRSTNTHLHLLEAYTTLCATSADPRVARSLRTLVELVLERIIAPGGQHVVGFFSERWEPRSSTISFGHDIETSWLLVDAARALGDGALLDRAEQAALALAGAVLEHAVDPVHGGIYYERRGDALDTDKEWWPQTEAIVGFLAAYQATGRDAFLDAAAGTWRFIERHLLDRTHGEWYRRVSRDGATSRGCEKVGPWKCPYHSARACLEVLSRTEALLGSAALRGNE